MIVARSSDTSVPLVLALTDALGLVTGATARLSIREASGDALDFDDGVFKASGWTTKYVALTEGEPGFYAYDFDPSAVSFGAEPVHHVLFETTDPSVSLGVATEALLIDALNADLATPADVLASEAVITAAIATVPTAGDNADAVFDEPLADHQGAGSTGQGIARLYGGNTRTKLFFADATIATAGRDVPADGVSHMEVSVRDEGGSFPGLVYYVVFNYAPGDAATSAPKSSSVSATAPVDGSFNSYEFPS